MNDFMERSIAQRKADLKREWQQMLDDAAHWNRIHPNDPQIIIEPLTAEELRTGIPRPDGVHS